MGEKEGRERTIEQYFIVTKRQKEKEGGELLVF